MIAPRKRVYHANRNRRGAWWTPCVNARCRSSSRGGCAEGTLFQTEITRRTATNGLQLDAGEARWLQWTTDRPSNSRRPTDRYSAAIGLRSPRGSSIRAAPLFHRSRIENPTGRPGGGGWDRGLRSVGQCLERVQRSKRRRMWCGGGGGGGCERFGPALDCSDGWSRAKLGMLNLATRAGKKRHLQRDGDYRVQ
ncbi:hypothetical protein BO71DRAFT_25319 [Aspergillus ellipticus CBS 707.79]|uniref:Uncharacterized protein n=1 Tax=Aspergillus ellipticus CBS 707.79 TaxID=1448320 RepID=A0A319D5L1_9EURO|nr:hypothetical protein BO71DRAFT_25319 [Aspergillus ellipticus CBS 707.79]